VDNRIAYGLKIYRIPGHCGGRYEDTCYVGGERNNNKPARERGELVPPTGWEAGIEVSHVVARNVRIPFTNAAIEKIVIGTQGSLIGGTPFDNAEALSYGASLSAYLTKRLVVGIRGTGLYNLNHEVVRDERNARHDTALTQYGPFVAYKREW